MDPTVTVALISAAGVILAGLFTLLGVRFTQRQARRAAEATAALDRDKVDAAAYEAARATWAESVAELRKQITDLRADRDLDKQTIRELRARVEELEGGQRTERRQFRELADYARTLLRILAENEITYPPPPAALDAT